MKKIFVGVLAVATASAFADTLVFDSMTGVTGYTFTGSTPRAMEGMGFNLGNVAGGPVTITGMDFAYVSTTAATYQNLEFDISFFNVSTGATTGTGAAFTGLNHSYFFTTGPVSRAANTVYSYQNATPGSAPGVGFGVNPFTFANINNVGIQILVKADIGAGLVANDNLTFGLRTTTAPAVGSFSVGTPGTNGFYRNASQASPTNAMTSLLGSDFRIFTGSTNIGMALRLYAAAPVPEPATMAVLGLGAAALLRRRKKA